MANEKKFALSIIIPAYNNPADLVRLLDSIAQYATPDIEVWVIDDGSRPSLKEKVLPYGYKYYYQENKGPAASRNTGARLASADAFFFLDSDTAVLPDTLAKVLKIIKEPGFKVGSIPYYPRSMNKGRSAEFKGFFNAFHIWYRRTCGPTQAFNGSSVLFQREAFFAAGGWDEHFKTPSMEHEEFSVRIIKKFPIILYPDVFVYHSYPSFKKLITTIFLRTLSWTRLKMENKVDFDDITRTKLKAAIALLPLGIVALSVWGIFNHRLWWLLIPFLALHFVFTIPFLRFLLLYSSFTKALVYLLIHFIFLLVVGIGAFVGALTFIPYKLRVGIYSCIQPKIKGRP